MKNVSFPEEKKPRISDPEKPDYILRQFQVATAAMSVIPLLAFFYLVSNTLGFEAFVLSRALVIFIVVTAIIGMVFGRALILNLIRQLGATNTELRRVSEMKTAFLRNVAHEAGTPLATLRANLEALRDELHGHLDQPAKTAVAASLRQTERLLRMVNDLLDISLIEQGKLPMRYGRVNLTALLRESAEAAGQASGDSRIRIERTEAPRWLESADRDRIMQVLVNLLRNAQKYSPEDAPITLGAVEKGEAYEVFVADKGDGVPPDFRERIFEPFVRNTQRRVEGVGLGLSISRHIVAEHGGRIWVEENPGGGSVFKFEIPRQEGPRGRAAGARGDKALDLIK